MMSLYYLPLKPLKTTVRIQSRIFSAKIQTQNGKNPNFITESDDFFGAKIQIVMTTLETNNTLRNQ